MDLVYLVLAVASLGLTTADIILTIIGVLITVGLGVIVKNQSVQGKTLVEQGKILVALNTKFDSLPMESMQADIKSQRHKTAQLDNEVSRLGERVGAIERTLDGVKQFCNKHHGGNL